MSYCGDYTTNSDNVTGTEVAFPQSCGAVPAIEDVKEFSGKRYIQSMLSDTPVDTCSFREEDLDINQRPVEKDRLKSEFAIVDLGSVASTYANTFSTFTTKDTEKTISVDEGKRESPKNGICSRKTFIILSVFFAVCLSVLLIAMIFRTQRESSSVGPVRSAIHDESNTLISGDPTSLHTGEAIDTADTKVESQGFLAGEGEICSRNDDCESALCRGNSPPYICYPKKGSCNLCHDDRNCLSGNCVRRSGKSICAATEDGLMDDGCLCDADDHCQSGRCEGELMMYTCKPKTTYCTSDSDCSWVCNNGQCSDGVMGIPGKRQPTGDHCSGHEDCSSRLCVGFSLERDGLCSEGVVGSICGTNNDCATERCIQGFCESKQVVGGACKGNIECSSGLCIGHTNFNSGLCLNTSEENSCHDEGEVCGDNGVCIGGFCKSFNLAEGSVCLDDSDCLSNSCSWSQAYAEQRCAN